MARARNIKPKFFTNEQLVGVSFAYRLLFIGLWTVADRAGRLADRPLQIKLQVFPGDDVDVNAGLDELVLAGLLLRYSVDGIKYIQILTFNKHQNPHKDESVSEIPAPYLHCASTVVAPDLQGNCRADSLSLDSLNLSPDPSIPHAKPTRGKKTSTDDPDFDEAYDAYPKRPGCSKQDALKAWGARLRDGAKPDAIIAGVRRYAAYVAACHTEPNFIKMPATFFGPGKHYESDWTPPQARAGPTSYQTPNEKAKAFADSLTGKNRNERPAIIDINDAPA